jgi:Tfp pilus assembly protein PilV
MRSLARRRLGRGTSLVEAMVAMAVMALGMLAVLGVQGTLRQNADIAKQRSEAVRIAQEAMESARAFTAIETTAGQLAYADLVDVAGVAVPGYTTNTQYMLSRTVVAQSGPDRKEIQVRVDWIDRNGDTQGVVLNSVIGANDPRVSRALGARPNGIPARLPLGRHPAIPVQAKTLGGGISAFKPPSASGQVVWVFNDLSGVIVGVCNMITTGQAELTAADVSSCSNNANGLPLSGFVRFSTGLTQPTAADAENPTSTALNLSVQLTLTSTGHASPDHACYAGAPTSALTTSTVVPYFCAVFFLPNTVPLWSGISTLTPLAFAEPTGSLPWTIATDAADTSATHYRVCRYTPATSDAQPIPNQLHPRQYTDVKALDTLTNQNFLVIRAGNATLPAEPDASPVAFVCPADGPIDPSVGDLVNSNTLVHQPTPAP